MKYFSHNNDNGRLKTILNKYSEVPLALTKYSKIDHQSLTIIKNRIEDQTINDLAVEVELNKEQWKLLLSTVSERKETLNLKISENYLKTEYTYKTETYTVPGDMCSVDENGTPYEDYFDKEETRTVEESYLVEKDIAIPKDLINEIVNIKNKLNQPSINIDYYSLKRTTFKIEGSAHYKTYQEVEEERKREENTEKERRRTEKRRKKEKIMRIVNPLGCTIS
jgi:hypothetical protein